MNLCLVALLYEVPFRTTLYIRYYKPSHLVLKKAPPRRKGGSQFVAQTAAGRVGKKEMAGTCIMVVVVRSK
jgi:hypothetical protein